MYVDSRRTALGPCTLFTCVLALTPGITDCGRIAHAIVGRPAHGLLRQQDGGACGLVARFDPLEASFESTVGASRVVEIANEGHTTATFDADSIDSAILGYVFEDRAGRTLYTIPPGIPPAGYQPRIESLAPGGRRRFTIGLHVFSPPLPRGEYTLQVRALGSCSERGRFTITR